MPDAWFAELVIALLLANAAANAGVYFRLGYYIRVLRDHAQRLTVLERGLNHAALH